MESTISLGRVAGIRIGLNWSVLVIAWLICWGLATEGFPSGYPGHAATAYWAAGVSASLLFFASLVAHELGHSLMGRRVGVNVSEITLWMLGGMAKLDQEADRPEDELRIAVVGPAVSVALSFLFGLTAGLLDVVGAHELIVAVLVWLATINLVLAIFNLMPAFPMDGGRVLRSWLWRRNGDKLRATRAAATAGRGFGWALIAVGLVVVTGGGGLGGLWFGLIGLFLLFASGMEASSVEQRHLLQGVLVRDVMTPDPICAPGDISVAQLLDRFVLHHHVSAYPVLDTTGGVVGLATLNHLRGVPADRRPLTPVHAIAEPIETVPVASPDTPLAELLPRLATSTLGRALVFDDGRLAGIVSLTDVSRALEIRDLVAQR